MSNTTPDSGGDTARQEEKSQLVESMTGALDQWRSRIDELKVQAGLGKLDARERAANSWTSRRTLVLPPARNCARRAMTRRSTPTPSVRACRSSSTTSKRPSRRRKPSSPGADPAGRGSASAVGVLDGSVATGERGFRARVSSQRTYRAPPPEPSLRAPGAYRLARAHDDPVSHLGIHG